MTLPEDATPAELYDLLRTEISDLRMNTSQRAQTAMRKHTDVVDQKLRAAHYGESLALQYVADRLQRLLDLYPDLDKQ